MMQAVRGIYRGGVVELLETPEVTEDAEVVVTFLGALHSLQTTGESMASISGDLQPLEDFEPVVPLKPIQVSDLVLEGRE